MRLNERLLVWHLTNIWFAFPGPHETLHEDKKCSLYQTFKNWSLVALTLKLKNLRHVLIFSRQREKMIHPLEMTVDCNGRRLNYSQPRAMVKMFSRPAAGQEVKASDVRPVPVLLKTLRYLLTKWVHHHHVNFNSINGAKVCDQCQCNWELIMATQI